MHQNLTGKGFDAFFELDLYFKMDKFGSTTGKMPQSSDIETKLKWVKTKLKWVKPLLINIFGHLSSRI